MKGVPFVYGLVATSRLLSSPFWCWSPFRSSNDNCRGLINVDYQLSTDSTIFSSTSSTSRKAAFVDFFARLLTVLFALQLHVRGKNPGSPSIASRAMNDALRAAVLADVSVAQERITSCTRMEHCAMWSFASRAMASLVISNCWHPWDWNSSKSTFVG